ncbi:MAG: hypothetical protein IPP94_12575 [Ignavibacteria bacterium]|nr:hypothetical protein [Ignavibacteria bacterium]
MKIFTFAMLCATALLFTSCSKDDATVTPPNSTTAVSEYWMPTAAGSRIILEEVSVTKMGSVTMDSSVRSTTMTMMPGTKTTLDGKSALIIQNIGSSKSVLDTSYSYLVLTAESMVMYDDSLKAEDATVQLKAPLTVGNNWLLRSMDTVRCTIQSVTETVVTPAGTFQNCIRVRALPPFGEDVTATSDFYFAKGVGVVKYEVLATGDVGGFTYTMRVLSTLKSKSF